MDKTLKQSDISKLHKLLVDHFSLEEIKTLSFNLGVDYEELGEGGKTSRVRELIRILGSKKRLSHLVTAAMEARPTVTSWPEFDEDLELLDEDLPWKTVDSHKGIRIEFKTALLLVIPLILAGAAAIYYLLQQPSNMTGDFNIAVAEFGEITDEGIVASSEARQISGTLFNFLDSEFEAADFDLDVQIAHSNLPIIEGGEDAENLARQINADIIIYGTVFVGVDKAEFSPRFFVSNSADVEEITGQNELAHPIEFDLADLGFQDEVNLKLRSRASILLSFTEGLVYHSNKDFNNALTAFGQAIALSEAQEPFAGQELLYLMFGNTYRKLGNYESAEQYFNDSLQLNPDYARAHVGLGIIYYEQAIADWDNANEKLEQALSEYDKALDAKDKPSGAYVTEKVNTGIGNALVVQAQLTGNTNLYDDARDYYLQVTERYESTKNEGVREIAAIAYFGLGVIYAEKNDYENAIEAYQQSIDLTEEPMLRSQAEEQLMMIR